MPESGALDAPSLSRAIREKALSLGADLVGIAPAELPPSPGGFGAYKSWVERGMHGEMAYLARDVSARDSILRWFPAARSVILTAYSYAGKPEPARSDGRGRIARYALSADYHRTLKAKAHELLAWLQAERPGLRGKAFVDTSPVLERLYGRYAGLGWIGKNSMLLSARIGSFFFLTGLAVDAELPADEPAPEHCGSCNRCLQACPTDAFPAPRVLDATKCIAYYTIEHRGPIPAGFRPGVGDWVFGCDVCQEVCPWNRFAAPNPALPPVIPPELELAEAAALSQEDFERRFAATPIERTGRAGLVRNALLAMGNSADPRYVPMLEARQADPDPAIAEQAAWSLERLRTATPPRLVAE